MPQIKFSGLVTDMKGKAGGSVFSSNKQGTYMRNNKWGGGRKSKRWDNSKARLGQLSNSWNLLSERQKNGWNNAAADFPFMNKFGEPYIASGYQVYMSLNGNLLAHNFPILTEPGAKRPFPDDAQLTFSQPNPGWVTGGTGVTFPNPPLRGCTDEDPPPEGCADCEDCFNGDCYPVGGSTESAEYLECKQGIENIYFEFTEDECSADSDCVDLGLAGATPDVACVDGKCVYVGDGLMNWTNMGYVLNLQNVLPDGGDWNFESSPADAEINGSFRITLGPRALKALSTTQKEIVLLSNYQADGRGLSIRIRPQDQRSTRVYFTYGLVGDITSGDTNTYLYYIDVETSIFQTNTVIQYRLSLSNTNDTSVAVGNTGWLPMVIETYPNLQTGAISTWADTPVSGANPLTEWATITQSQGLVFGGGVLGMSYDLIISDIRIFRQHQKYSLDTLIGYLTGDETVVILATGDTKPQCSYANCTQSDNFCGTRRIKCNCAAGVCGPWRQIQDKFANIAPGGDSSIRLVASVPVFTTLTINPNTYEFAGYWMEMLGGSFANNGATYVPNVLLDVQAPRESGFFAVLCTSMPKGYTQNNRWSPVVTAGVIDLNVNSQLNLWEYLAPLIVHAPPGTSFDTTIYLVDSNSGYAQIAGRTKPRFKAGAELSSTVF
jgi:hypothetical protein